MEVIGEGHGEGNILKLELREYPFLGHGLLTRITSNNRIKTSHITNKNKKTPTTSKQQSPPTIVINDSNPIDVDDVYVDVD